MYFPVCVCVCVCGSKHFKITIPVREYKKKVAL